MVAQALLFHPDQPVPASTRLTAYYFLHFAVIGAVVPFIALWFAWLGHPSWWIGLVVATPSFLMVTTTLTLGSWADRLGDWRTAIIVCNWLAMLLTGWWLFRTGALDLWIIWTLVGVISMAKQPILDAAALDLTRREGMNFGRIRAFGSIGFIVSLIASGQWYRNDGIANFLIVILAIGCLRLLAAHQLPRFRAAKALNNTKARSEEIPTLLRHPGFLCVLAGAALINASHAFYYTFGLLHWQSIGIGTTTGSLLWAVAIVVEVVLMWQFTRLSKHVSARHCIAACGLAGLMRWGIMATDPGLVWLTIIQTLHALTFGLCFLATATFISRRIPPAHAARAQSVFAIMTTGSMATMTVFSGSLYEAFSGLSYIVMAVVATVGLALVMASYRSNLDEWTHEERAAPHDSKDMAREAL